MDGNYVTNLKLEVSKASKKKKKKQILKKEKEW